MSDTTQPTDAAIEAIDERVRALNANIAAHGQRLAIDTATRDALIDLRDTLTRPRRLRRPRAVDASDGAAMLALQPTPDAPSPPVLFKTPDAAA